MVEGLGGIEIGLHIAALRFIGLPEKFDTLVTA